MTIYVCPLETHLYSAIYNFFTYIGIRVTDVHLNTMAKHHHRECVISLQSECLQKGQTLDDDYYY